MTFAHKNSDLSLAVLWTEARVLCTLVLRSYHWATFPSLNGKIYIASKLVLEVKFGFKAQRNFVHSFLNIYDKYLKKCATDLWYQGSFLRNIKSCLSIALNLENLTDCHKHWGQSYQPCFICKKTGLILKDNIMGQGPHSLWEAAGIIHTLLCPYNSIR